jgi:4-hydroxybenzoate polyprenyltransferase
MEGHASYEVYSTLAAICTFFLGYFILRLVFVDRSPQRKPDEVAISLKFAYFLYSALLLVGVAMWWLGALRNFWLILSVTLPCAMMFISSCRNHKNLNHPTAHRFLPRVFYPAFSICFLCFCLGWALTNRTGPTKLLSLSQGEIIYCASALIILALYYVSWRGDTPKTISAVFTMFLFGALAVSVRYYDAVGLSLLIGLLWTFALGVPEVAKQPYLIKTERAFKGTVENPQFYEAGANWSSVLFFNLLLFLPMFIPTVAMLFVVAIAWFCMVVWHALGDKASAKAYWSALGIGYLLPVGIIYLFVLAKLDPPQFQVPLSKDHQTDRLVALLGVFLTIIFVLYHDSYRIMPRRLKLSSEWFRERPSCLLFAALTVAVEAVMLAVALSILSYAQQVGYAVKVEEIQFQVDVILIALIVELIAILLLLLLYPPNSDECDKRGDSVPGQMTPLTSSMALVRPTMSCIAGSLAVVSILRVSEFDLFSSVALFVGTTSLCMFGYVANDIFDLKKDALAGRADKLIATGAVSVDGAAALATALALTSLLMASLLGLERFALMGGCLFLAFGYSHFSRCLPKLKGAYTAVLCCLPILIASGADLSRIDVGLFFVILLFIFGREMIIDVTDMHYDRLAGHSTLALSLGARRALVIGWSLMLASGPLIFAIQSGFVGKILGGLAMASLALIIVLQGFKDAERAVVLTRIPMILTIALLVFRP